MTGSTGSRNRSASVGFTRLLPLLLLVGSVTGSALLTGCGAVAGWLGDQDEPRFSSMHDTTAEATEPEPAPNPAVEPAPAPEPSPDVEPGVITPGPTPAPEPAATPEPVPTPDPTPEPEPLDSDGDGLIDELDCQPQNPNNAWTLVDAWAPGDSAALFNLPPALTAQSDGTGLVFSFVDYYPPGNLSGDEEDPAVVLAGTHSSEIVSVTAELEVLEEDDRFDTSAGVVVHDRSDGDFDLYACGLDDTDHVIVRSSGGNLFVANDTEVEVAGKFDLSAVLSPAANDRFNRLICTGIYDVTDGPESLDRLVPAETGRVGLLLRARSIRLTAFRTCVP